MGNNERNIFHINLFQPSVAFHTETSHIFCRTNQMTGFYIKMHCWAKIG